jgi:DNA mismatch repair ATPase MutS
VQNHSVSVYETDKEVVFMKKIVKWWASKSYGLDVAKIAWIPMGIIERARENLNALQNEQWTMKEVSMNSELWTMNSRQGSKIWEDQMIFGRIWSQYSYAIASIAIAGKSERWNGRISV